MTGRYTGKQALDKLLELVYTGIQDSIIPTISVTYSELVELVNNSQLKPGQWYKVTDYQATSITENTTVTTTTHPLYLMALDKALLSVWGFYGDNGYLVEYLLDNDANQFAWADSTNGKGVIYFMMDDKGNSMPFDFENIHYLVNEKEVTPFGTENYNNIINPYRVNNVAQLPFITLGDRCNHNVFGYDNHHIVLGNNYAYNSFEDNVAYLNLPSSTTKVLSEIIYRYIKVKSGVAGTPNESLELSSVNENLNYQTTFAMDSEGTLNKYCEEDSISADDINSLLGL